MCVFSIIVLGWQEDVMRLKKETPEKKKSISKMDIGEIWARIYVISGREP